MTLGPGCVAGPRVKRPDRKVVFVILLTAASARSHWPHTRTASGSTSIARPVTATVPATAPSVTLGPTEQAAHPSREQFITSSSIGSGRFVEWRIQAAGPISRSTRLKSRCFRSWPCRSRESGESAGDTGRAMLQVSMLAKFERVRRIAVTQFNEFGPMILGSLLPDGV
jgi:hypothetical protein